MWIKTMSVIGGVNEYSFGWPLERYESDKPPYGRKVVFLDRNGYDIEREHAAKFFQEGQVLMVKEIYVGRNTSKVEIVGFPGHMFNTVMFADLEEYNKWKKQNCPHTNKFTYNHGYHTICQDCGEEL